MSVGPPGPNQKAYFVQFSLPVNFVVLIIVAYGSESGSWILILILILKSNTDPDPQHWPTHSKRLPILFVIGLRMVVTLSPLVVAEVALEVIAGRYSIFILSSQHWSNCPATSGM